MFRELSEPTWNSAKSRVTQLADGADKNKFSAREKVLERFVCVFMCVWEYLCVCVIVCLFGKEKKWSQKCCKA